LPRPFTESTDKSEQTQNPSLTLGIDHLGLTVPDLNTTVSFFVDCLGWKRVGGRPSYPAAFVSDGHVVLTLWEVTRQAERVAFDRKTNVGLHHLALRVGSAAALDEIFARVAQWPGVVVEFAPENLGDGPKRHTMICEPGGIRIEFDFDPRIAAA